jgi:hypothetical protein
MQSTFGRSKADSFSSTGAASAGEPQLEQKSFFCPSCTTSTFCCIEQQYGQKNVLMRALSSYRTRLEFSVTAQKKAGELYPANPEDPLTRSLPSQHDVLEGYSFETH